KGIGRQLFDYAKEQLQNKGADRMELYCNKYNLPAQRFYEKMGCEVVSIDPDHPDKSIPQIKFICAF
ncbi:MAG: GNAT family N-acetyltransferase, partial [Clostridia bacterium]|nr:GNAT family N-acetyltransferase [Clostridia bacterium]